MATTNDSSFLATCKTHGIVCVVHVEPVVVTCPKCGKRCKVEKMSKESAMKAWRKRKDEEGAKR
jgi:hypothetical protein